MHNMQWYVHGKMERVENDTWDLGVQLIHPTFWWLDDFFLSRSALLLPGAEVQQCPPIPQVPWLELQEWMQKGLLKGRVLWKEKSRFASRLRSWILMLSKFHHIVSIKLDRPCRLWSFDTRCIYFGFDFFGFDFCLVIALWVLVAAWLRLNGIPTRGWRMMRHTQQRWDRGTVCQNWKIQSKPWYFRKTWASHGICQHMRHHVIWSGHANTC